MFLLLVRNRLSLVATEQISTRIFVFISKLQGRSPTIISISKVRDLRLREANQTAEGHVAGKWHHWDLNQVSLSSRCQFMTYSRAREVRNSPGPALPVHPQKDKSKNKTPCLSSAS